VADDKGSGLRLKSWLGPILFLIIVLLASAYGWRPRQPTLVALQREYLFATTDSERSKAASRLEKYYETLAIPEAITQRLDQEVKRFCESAQSDAMACARKENPNSVYEDENHLQHLVKLAMIFRVKDQLQESDQCQQQAAALARNVEQATRTGYWPRFVDTLRISSKKDAVSWLKALAAERLSRENSDNQSSWKQAEYYGAVGLRLSRQTRDTRLELDLIQTLQFLLNEYYGFNDLSIAFSDVYLKQAQKIRYDLRTMGITYHHASALQRSGQFDSALKFYGEVLKMSTEYDKLQSARWYATKAFLKTAEVYRELGRYEDSLSVCNRVAQMDLGTEDKILLHIARGLVMRSLADYEAAERDYKAALVLAEASENLLDAERILNDLGTLYFLLTEYDRAQICYNRAKEFQDRIVSGQGTSEIDLLINMAAVNAKQGKGSLADEYIERASHLVELGSLPWKKAELFNSLGELCLKVRHDDMALNHFQKAVSICDENGLARVGLQAKVNLAETLTRLSRLDQGHQLSLETAELARQINDPERVIDALALLAKIAARRGDFPGAVRISDTFIQEMQDVVGRFKNEQRLISFQQKIYEYLKQAVLYEIGNQRPDLAFLKLDYAKTLWRSGFEKNGRSQPIMRVRNPIELDGLKGQIAEAHALVIQYMVTPEMLYAFVLDGSGIQVLHKPIKMEMLRSRVGLYKATIDQTAEMLVDYKPKRLEDHYANTTRLGRQLFDDLLGWSAIQSDLAVGKVIYVVPDDFLYELPISTLVGNLGGKTCFLAEKASVLNVPSAFLAVGRPDRDQSIAKRVLISADPRLPGATDLVASIKSRFPGAEELTIIKDSIDKQDVLEKIHQPYQVYILFGHGKANSQYPELSYIELTAKNTVNHSSRTFQVSMTDLQGANWSGAELIWLVGCETAGGKLYESSGISGLQQSLLALGAHSVLASLWKIDAAQAVPQVEWFLENWSHVSDPVIAFNQVQRRSIQALNQDRYYRKPHPYLWGSYSYAMSAN
jgi:CHAT domain-containing protein/tetratricopeptide (TPR) repeat protein